MLDVLLPAVVSERQNDLLIISEQRNILPPGILQQNLSVQRTGYRFSLCSGTIPPHVLSKIADKVAIL